MIEIAIEVAAFLATMVAGWHLAGWLLGLDW